MHMTFSAEIPGRRLLRALTLLLLIGSVASASTRATCVNKYVHRKSGPRVSFTLLTGMLNFEEARTLANAIAEGEKSGIEWIHPDGKVIARQFGDLKVVRPMPVACEGKGSGVVLQAVFATAVSPGERVRVRFDESLEVDFIAQKN
ncbi:MAG TPA: hypothetical protein VM557_05395 [Thermoanaerobaculia bacterium]|nr:hypothetical protein [Thermoanaerobaculia bacterium]